MKKSKPRVFTRQFSSFLPLMYIILSLILILLPLQTTVNSVRAVLAYIFIPQLRAAHSVREYISDVSEGVETLLNVSLENYQLKEENRDLQIKAAQIPVVLEENQRLTSALTLKKSDIVSGVWAKIAYKDFSRTSSIIVDKGNINGVQRRSPVLSLTKEGQPALAGIVIEVSVNTAKVLLLNDEDFSAYAYVLPSKREGLLTGRRFKEMVLKYIPLEENLVVGQNVFTSSSSALFPEGILIGHLSSDGSEGLTSASSYKMPTVATALEVDTIKEVLILSPKAEVK